METAFSVRTHSVDGATVISVSGEIDVSTSPALDDALQQCAGGHVVVDLTDVGFLDSSGLTALIAAHRRLQRGGHRLEITNPSLVVERLLAVTGLDGYLHVRDGTRQAS